MWYFYIYNILYMCFFQQVGYNQRLMSRIQFWCMTHRIHVIYLQLPQKSTIHVGKYTSPMDPMGDRSLIFPVVQRSFFFPFNRIYPMNGWEYWTNDDECIVLPNLSLQILNHYFCQPIKKIPIPSMGRTVYLPIHENPSKIKHAMDR